MCYHRRTFVTLITLGHSSDGTISKPHSVAMQSSGGKCLFMSSSSLRFWARTPRMTLHELHIVHLLNKWMNLWRSLLFSQTWIRALFWIGTFPELESQEAHGQSFFTFVRCMLVSLPSFQINQIRNCYISLGKNSRIGLEIFPHKLNWIKIIFCSAYELDFSWLKLSFGLLGLFLIKQYIVMFEWCLGRQHISTMNILFK